MIVHAGAVIGFLGEPRFAERRVVEVVVAWDEAGRRRLRRTAADGTDVAIQLTGGAYLADGAVLLDDGERVIAVSRPAEPALVIRFDPATPRARLVAHALMIGHAFGNQHTPVDVEDGEVRVPLTTSESVARATVEALALDDLRISIEDVALGRQRPLGTAHHHDHPSEDR